MPKSDAFNRLTELAAAMFDAPIALITVLEDDRQWFRAKRGYGPDQTTRDESFCAHMAGGQPGTVLVVEDAARDGRFAANRLVTEEGVRFYAGALITTSDGASDGAVCVIDTQPRAAPTDAQMESLRMLARIAGQEIDHGRLRRLEAERTAMLEMAETMAGVGHWRYEIATGERAWSDEVYRIHGLEPGSVDPKAYSAEAQYHPGDYAEIWRLIERAIQTGEGYDTRLRLTVHGEERVTRARASVEYDEAGAPVALFGVYQDITETVRAQERIERSEALFRLMTETSSDIVARFDDKGRFLYVSPSAKAVLGRDPADMLGKDCTGIIPEADLKVIRQTLIDYVAAGPGASPPRYEYPALKADGTSVWLEATPRAIRDDTGRVTEFHDFVRDVTGRKAGEQAQQELLETLKLAEDLAGLGSWKLDVLTGQVHWSDQVYRIHGVDPKTFDPSLDDAVAFYHPDDRQAVRDWCASAIETGVGGEFRLRLIRADGDERIVVSQCRPDIRDGAVVALYGVFQDVTEQVRAQATLAASEARYRLMADRASDIIVTYGTDGLIRYVSPSVEAATGLVPESLLGKPVTSLIHAEDVPALTEAFREMVRTNGASAREGFRYRGLTLNDTTRWFEARTTMIRDESGRVIEFHDAVRDVTATKALEDELIAARDGAENAARAKSEFLANMSHELRTPLTSVIGFSGLLKDSPALPDAERRYADRIATASEALLGVINDILDYSKLEAEAVDLDPQPFDPAETARGAAAIVEAQCAAKGLTLTLAIDGGLPAALMGDAGRIRQVLLNFLSNAVKFTVSGEVRLESRWIDGRLRVAVSDSGIGISPEKIDALFERFTQADASTTRVYGGTGLGLAISRRLVEMMGGEIGANSRPGEGSTFWFEVPLPVAEAGDADEADAVSDLPAGLKVLMADDAPANRELVRIILAGWDIELETVENGAEAVQAAAKGAHDLILMDVHMPVMDGMDATRAIRALPGAVGRVPVIALTANVQPVQVEACHAAGMDAHVGKPIQVGELIATMAQALSRSMDENAGERAA